MNKNINLSTKFLKRTSLTLVSLIMSYEVLVVILNAIIFSESGKCGMSSYTGICGKLWDLTTPSFLNSGLIVLIPILFLFSLTTFWMREEVFRRWAKFAAWFVPVLLLVTLWISNQSNGGYGAAGAIQSSFSYLVLWIFYGAFVITSVVKIVRAHKHSKSLEDAIQ